MAEPPLFSAIKHKPETVELLIKEGVDINQVFNDMSAVQFATREGNVSAVQLLLEHGADMSPRDENDKTPLYSVCRKESDDNTYDLCKLFLEKEADSNLPDHEGRTPFHFALQNQSLKVIKLLLKFGANIAMADQRKGTALHFAATNRRVDVIEFVIDRGFDMEVCDVENITPLMLAVDHDKFEVCKFLIKRGAKVNAINSREERRSPLALAVTPQPEYTQSAKIIEILLEHGATVDTGVLSGALQNQPLEIIKLLLKFGDNIAIVDVLSALHHAALNRRVDVIEFVLDQGLHVDTLTSDDVTPLMIAIDDDNLEVCKFLVKRGANVNRKSKHEDCSSPLALAVTPQPEYTETAKIVDILLASGATVDYEVLVLAANERRMDIRNALMRHLAKVECQKSNIDEEIRQLIEDDGSYNIYYQGCVQELKTMRETKIYNNVSVVRILIGSDKEISGYSRNEELVESLAGQDFDKMFPIYFTSIDERFSVAVQKQRLCDDAGMILSSLLVVNHLSHPVIQNVLRYLADEEMKFCIENFSQINVSVMGRAHIRDEYSSLLTLRPN